MADRGTANQDLFQDWLASSRAFFAGDSTDAPMAEPLKQKCEELFAAWRRFSEAYSGARDAASGGPGGDHAGGAADDLSGGPFDPVGWLDTAGSGGFGDLWRWFGGPADADPWRAQRDALRASREWLAYGAALERYRAVMGAAWLQAFKRFSEDMAAARNASANLPDWQTIQTCWEDAASAELAAAQRSDDFLAAQRDLIRTRLDCSALLRGQAERLAEALGLPTRAELDALHQTVHNLNRELRTLRARLDEGA
jgi:hypothetical protein